MMSAQQPRSPSPSPLLLALLLAASPLLLAPAARATEGDYALSLDPPPPNPALTTAASAALPSQDADIHDSLPLLDASTLPSSDKTAAPSSKQLQLSFELPIWLPGMNGTVGVRGRVVPANASFTQILDATDSILAFGGRLEADYGPWIFYGSGLYMKLAKDNIAPPPTNISFVSQLTIADAGILYQIGKWNISGNGGSANPSISLAAGAAARYMHVGLHLNFQRISNRQATADWADPLFAGQVILNLDKHWSLLARGDIGGGSSQETWSVGAFLAYHFNFNPTVSGTAKIGYEALYEDYTQGSGNQKFTWDEILHGPLLSFAVQF